MLAAMQHGPGPPGDLLERSVPYRDRPRGCTLKMSPSDLASRRYDRLWGSEEHFQEWLNMGGEPRNTSTNTSGYRRMHTPKSWLRGGEVIVEVPVDCGPRPRARTRRAYAALVAPGRTHRIVYT